MNIDLHIEELVLAGFARADRHRIGAAIESELARLLTERGLSSFAQNVDISRLDGGSFEARPGDMPERTGAQVAGAIYRGMDR